MSLDIYLKSETPVLRKGTGVFVRDSGSTRELQTIREVENYFPDADTSHIQEFEYETNEVFQANITHNLGEMADKAGIYNALWRPYRLIYEGYEFKDYDEESKFEESVTIKAKQLIKPLREGLHKLLDNPEEYKKYNPDNGWGTYEQLVELVKNYLDACYKYKEAIVITNR